MHWMAAATCMDRCCASGSCSGSGTNGGFLTWMPSRRRSKPTYGAQGDCSIDSAFSRPLVAAPWKEKRQNAQGKTGSDGARDTRFAVGRGPKLSRVASAFCLLPFAVRLRFCGPMTPTSFAFTLTMPGDPRLVAAVRHIAVQAAGYAQLTAEA